MSARTTLFVSYCHKDEKWLGRLQIHLKALQSTDLDLWDDTKIKLGVEWRREISAAIERAAIAVLLISVDFLASNFIANEEVPPLLANAENDGALILPIIVSPCRYKHSQLGRFQAANDPGMPLSSLGFNDSENIFLSVADRVDEILSQRSNNSQTETHSTATRLTKSEKFFERIKASMLCLRVLSLADGARSDKSLTISDYCSDLRIESRRSVVEGLKALTEVGWIERTRDGSTTNWRVTDRGTHQLQMLAKIAGAPLKLG